MMVFSALADSTRFQIIQMLANNGCMPVSEIGKHFTITAPAVSQHLKVLKESNLVSVEVRAQQRIYSLNPAGIREVEDWVSKTKRIWEARLDRLDALLHEETPKSKRRKK